MRSPTGEERLAIPDRRQEPTSAWDALLGGQRASAHRGVEQERPYFVDRHSMRTMALILALLLLPIADGVITLHLIPIGCGEMNPLMAELLQWGVVPFLVGKYILTAAGLPVLLVFKDSRLFGSRFHVSSVISVLVGLYVLLLIYQASLVIPL